MGKFVPNPPPPFFQAVGNGVAGFFCIDVLFTKIIQKFWAHTVFVLHCRFVVDIRQKFRADIQNPQSKAFFWYHDYTELSSRLLKSRKYFPRNFLAPEICRNLWTFLFSIKGTVARYFWPLVFFMNRPHMGPRYIPQNSFEFWFKLLEIFELKSCSAGYQTPRNKKPFFR